MWFQCIVFIIDEWRYGYHGDMAGKAGKVRKECEKEREGMPVFMLMVFCD